MWRNLVPVGVVSSLLLFNLDATDLLGSRNEPSDMSDEIGPRAYSSKGVTGQQNWRDTSRMQTELTRALPDDTSSSKIQGKGSRHKVVTEECGALLLVGTEKAGCAEQESAIVSKPNLHIFEDSAGLGGWRIKDREALEVRKLSRCIMPCVGEATAEPTVKHSVGHEIVDASTTYLAVRHEATLVIEKPMVLFQ